jgi:DNA-binding SARP family transcriptional activator
MSEDADEKQRALGLYLQSSLTNPQREDLVYNIMSLYDELDMVEDALASYERLKFELQDNLGVKPAPQLRDYAASLRERLN